MKVQNVSLPIHNIVFFTCFYFVCFLAVQQISLPCQFCGQSGHIYTRLQSSCDGHALCLPFGLCHHLCLGSLCAWVFLQLFGKILHPQMAKKDDFGPYWLESPPPPAAVWPGFQGGNSLKRDQECNKKWPIHLLDCCSCHLSRLLFLHHRLPLPQGWLQNGGGSFTFTRSASLIWALFFFFNLLWFLSRKGSKHSWTRHMPGLNVAYHFYVIISNL